MAAINTYPDATLPLTGTEAMIGTQSGQTVQILVSSIGNLTRGTLQAAAQGNLTPPASTTTYFMQGLNGNSTFTPSLTGTAYIQVSGTIINPSGTAAGNGINLKLSYGTGAAPVNGGNLAGTQVGPAMTYTNSATVTAADVHQPFSHSAIVSGLTLNTAYWIDEAAESVANASTVGLGNITITAFEL